MSHLRRPLAMFLAILMCLSLFPTSVFAEETQTAGIEEAAPAVVETAGTDAPAPEESAPAAEAPAEEASLPAEAARDALSEEESDSFGQKEIEAEEGVRHGREGGDDFGGGYSVMGVYNTDYPAITDFAIAEDGQTLTAGDTVHFSVRISDSNGISSAYMYFGRSLDNYRLDNIEVRLEYNEETGLYEGEYTFQEGDTPGEFFATFLQAFDVHRFYTVIFSNSRTVMQRLLPGSVTLSGDAPAVPVLDEPEEFSFAQNGQTLRPGDTLDVSFRLPQGLEINNYYISVGQINGSAYINIFEENMSYDAATGLVTVHYPLTDELYNGDYYIGYIHVDATDAEEEEYYKEWSPDYNKYRFSLTGARDKTSFPTITDFSCDENGQTLTDGDTLHFRFRVNTEAEVYYASVTLRLVENSSEWVEGVQNHSPGIDADAELNEETGYYEASYTFREDDVYGVYSFGNVYAPTSDGTATLYDADVLVLFAEDASTPFPRQSPATDVHWTSDGMACFTMPEDGDEADVKFYKEDGTRIDWWGLSVWDERTLTADCLRWMDLTTGRYYFTVTVRGNGADVFDSVPVRSDYFDYTAPEAQLPTPTLLEWEAYAGTTGGMRGKVTLPADKTHLGGMQYKFYYAETEDGTPQDLGGWSSSWFDEDGPKDYGYATLWTLQDRGSGYYAFSVRLVSDDFLACRNGDWSALSPLQYIDADAQVEPPIVEVAGYLTEDVWTLAEISHVSEGEELYFEFIPAESGYYYILGKDSTFVECHVYDEYLTPQDGWSEPYDDIYTFQTEAYLDAGSPYYIAVTPTGTEGVYVPDVEIAVHKQSFSVNTKAYANAEAGGSATLYVPVNWSDAALSYTWYEGDFLRPSARIEGADGSSYTTEAITSEQNYLCVVSDGFFEEVVLFTVYCELRIHEGETVATGVSGDDIRTVYFTPEETKAYTFTIRTDVTLPEGWYLNVWLNDAGSTLYQTTDNGEIQFTVDLSAYQRHFLNMMLTDASGSAMTGAEAGVIVSLEGAGSSGDPFESAQELAVGSLYTVLADPGSGQEDYYWFRAPVSAEYILTMGNDYWATVTVYDADREVLATTGGDWFWELRFEAAEDEIVYLSVRPTVSEYGLRVRVENHLTAENAAADWATFIHPGESAELQVAVTADDTTGLTYTWYRYVGENDGETIFYDSKTDTLLLPSSAVDPDRYYTDVYCEVTDRYGNLATARFSVHVDNDLSVWTNQYEYVIQPGESVRIPFNVAAIDHEGMRCLWLCDGVETEETGTVLETGPLYESHVYCFWVRDRYGNTEEHNVSVRIQNHFKAEAVEETLCPRYGEEVVLEVRVEADDLSGMQFCWRNNSGETLDETSAVLRPERPDYTGFYDDSYYCTVTDKYGSTEKVSFSVYWPQDPSTLGAQPIRLGETKEVSIEYEGGPVWFVFTPDVTARYVFVSQDEGSGDYPIAAAYDAEGRFLAYDERGQEDSHNFRLEITLEAGATCYLGTRPSGYIESYQVSLTRCFHAEAKEEYVTVPRYQSATLEVIAYPEAEGDTLHYAWSRYDYSTGTSTQIENDSPILTTEPVVDLQYYSCTVSDGKGHEVQVWIDVNFERPEGWVGDDVRWALSEDGTVLSLTGSGEMWDNTGGLWQEDASGITTVVVGEGITSVGRGAFMYLTALREVSLPDSLLSIKEYAFNRCGALQHIAIPASVKEIGDYAFAGCGLTEIALPAALTTLDAGVFSVCVSLQTLYLPHDFALRSIPDYCFNNCIALNTIDFDGSEAEWNALLAALTIGENNEAFTRAQVLFKIEKIGGLLATPDVNSVVLSWGMSTELTTDTYRIYRRAGEEEGFQLLATVNGRNTLAYTDHEVEPGVVYTYYVVGVDPHGRESAPSDPVSASSLSDTEKPQVLKMLPANGSRVHGQLSVTLYAQDNIAVTATELSYRTAGAEDWVVFALGEGATLQAALDTTALPDGVLQLRGLARDAVGNESSPLVYQLLVDNTPPAQVTGLAYQSTSVTMTLSWNDVADEDLGRFEVEQMAADGSYRVIASTSSVLGVNLKGLTPDTEYTYRVVAVDQIGNRSVPSEPITARTQKDGTAPVITKLLPLPGYYAEGIQVSITASDDYGVQSITLQTSPDGLFWTDVETKEYTAVAAAQTWSKRLSLTHYDEGLLYVRGVAKDFSGNVSTTDGTAPYVQHIVDRTAPAAPAELSAEGGSGYIGLSWVQGEEQDLDGYALYRAESAGGTYTLLADNLRVISYYDRTAAQNKTYYYKLQARDRAGNLSAFSEIVSAKAAADTVAPVVGALSPADGSVVSAASRTVRVAASDNLRLESILLELSADGINYTTLTEKTGIASNTGTVSGALPLEDFAHGSVVYVRAVATDESGLRSEYAAASYTVDTENPAVLAASARYDEAEDCVVVEWTGAQEPDLAGYRVYRRADGGSDSLIAQKAAVADTAAYSVRDYDLAAGAVSYVYRVEAVDSSGNVASRETEAVALPDRSKPVARLECDAVMEVGKEYLFDASLSRDDEAVVGYRIDFGDGSFAEERRPVHRYAATGTYTVTLTVWDAQGNEAGVTKSVNVRERTEIGTVRITVVDESGNPVPYAPVYFDLGAPEQTVRSTDQSGSVQFSAAAGRHTVGCVIADNEWLPVKKEVTVVAGQTTGLQMTLVHQTMIEGEFEIHRMTLEEIEAAGIDVSLPENQHQISIDIHLTYGEAVINTSIRYNAYTNTWPIPDPIIIHDSNGRKHEITPIPIPIPVPDPDPNGGGGGGGGGGGWGSSDDEPQLAVAFLDVPIEASFLKEFFNVNLFIINNASVDFRMVDNVVSLHVPDGMTLMDESTASESMVVNIPEIRGQSQQTISWILRGDREGEYPITADYVGTLDEFNVPITTRFESREPIKVYGLSGMKLIAEFNNNIYFDGFYFNLSLENISDIDYYLPSIGVADDMISTYLQTVGAAGARDVRVEQLSTVFTNSSGLEETILNPEVITKLSPGERITHKYAVYNAVNFNDLLYFQNVVKEVSKGYGIPFEIIVTGMDLFSLEDALRKLEEIKNDASKRALYNALMSHVAYYYIRESASNSVDPFKHLSEDMYELGKAIFEFDLNYTDDQCRNMVRSRIVAMLQDESLQVAVQDEIDNTYWNIANKMLKSVVALTKDTGSMNYELIGSYSNSAENILKLSIALKRGGTEGFSERLQTDLESLGVNVAVRTMIQLNYCNDTIFSDYFSGLKECCEPISRLVDLVNMGIDSWNEATNIYNQLVEIGAARKEAEWLLDALINQLRGKATDLFSGLDEELYNELNHRVNDLLYSELKYVREKLDSAEEEQMNQFFLRFGGAVIQDAGKDLIKEGITYIFGPEAKALYELLKLTFKLADYTFGWGDSVKDVQSLRVDTALSLAMRDAVELYGLDADSEGTAAYTLQALKYLIKLRILSEENYIDIMKGKDAETQAEILAGINAELHSAYESLDEYLSARIANILRSRDMLFAALGTTLTIPDAPAVTLDFLSGTASFTPDPNYSVEDYEYSYDGSKWYWPSVNVVELFPTEVPTYLYVRVRESSERPSGNITRATIPARERLLGNFTVSRSSGQYRVSGLPEGTYRYAFVNEREVEAFSGTFTVAAGKTVTLRESGKWTYLAVERAATAESFASLTRYLVPTEPDVKITQQPTDASGVVGKTVSFRVAATGNDLRYCWYQMGPTEEEWREADGDNSKASYSVTITAELDETCYYCLVEGSTGSVPSETVWLHVKDSDPFADAAALQPGEPQTAAYDGEGVVRFAVTADKSGSYELTVTGEGEPYVELFSEAGAKLMDDLDEPGRLCFEMNAGETRYCSVTDEVGDGGEITVTLRYLGLVLGSDETRSVELGRETTTLSFVPEETAVYKVTVTPADAADGATVSIRLKDEEDTVLAYTYDDTEAALRCRLEESKTYRLELNYSGAADSALYDVRIDSFGANACGETLSWEFDETEGILRILGSGAMWDFEPSANGTTAPWSAYANAIREVRFADAVSTVGSYAFYGCAKLAKLSLPSGLESIGGMAFCGDQALKTAQIPYGTAQIGQGAFCGSGLSAVSIPDTVTQIGQAAFADCGGLTEVRLPRTLKTLSASVFANTAIAELEIPTSVTRIEAGAFAGCSALVAVRYGGTEARWNEIAIDPEGNQPLLACLIRFVNGQGIFNSAEALKALCAESYSSESVFVYAGGEALSFTEPLVIPANLTIRVPAGTVLIVPEGVTLTVDGSLETAGLQVDGALRLRSGGSLSVTESLAVAGSIRAEGTGTAAIPLALWEPAFSDHVTVGRSADFALTAEPGTAEELSAALACAAAETNSALRYALSVKSELTTAAETTIPANTTVSVAGYGSCLSIPDGAVLTNRGSLQASGGGEIEILGMLVNEGQIRLKDAALSAIDTGEHYSGAGRIEVSGTEDPDSCLENFVLDAFIREESGGLTVYQKSSLQPYTLIYDPNGGSGEMAAQTVDPQPNEEYDGYLAENEFLYAFHSFTGWNTAADGSGDAYVPGDGVRFAFTRPGETVTLYAQWEPWTYLVSFHGGRLDEEILVDEDLMDDQPFVFDVKQALTKSSYTTYTYSDGETETEYYFIGWNTMLNGQGKTYADEAEVMNLASAEGQTVDLYAQWERVAVRELSLTAGSSLNLAGKDENGEDYLDRETIRGTVVWDMSEADAQYASVTSKGVVKAAAVTETHDVTVRARGEGMAFQKFLIHIRPAVASLSIYETDENGERSPEPITQKTVDLRDEDAAWSFALIAKALPDGADETVVWSSDKSAVAAVDENGTVTLGGASGTATITAASKAFPKIKASVSVKVVQLLTRDEIDFVDLPQSLRGGGSAVLKAVILDTEIKDTLVWGLSESSATHAAITAKGKLTTTAVSEPTEIEVQVWPKSNPDSKLSASITLLPAVQEAILTADSLTVRKGRTVRVTAALLPASAGQTGSWKLSSNKIAVFLDEAGEPLSGATLADVRAGSVTLKALKAGSVTLTFTAEDGSKVSAKLKLTVVDPAVAVESVDSIFLKGTETTPDESTVIESGKYVDLEAKVTGEGGKTPSNAKVVWSVDNEDAASVSASGRVTAKPFNADANVIVAVTATAADGCGAARSVKLAVKPSEFQLVNSISISVGKSSMLADGKQTLKAVVSPKDAKIKTIRWSSSDESAATVSAKGVVTAKPVSQATSVTIYAEAKDGSGVTARFPITVYPKATNVLIRMDGKEVNNTTQILDLAVSNTCVLSADVYPLHETLDEDVVWTSSNKKLLVFDDGSAAGQIKLDGAGRPTVTAKALKAGTVTVTATTKDGSKVKASFKLTIRTGVTELSLKVKANAEPTVRVGKKLTLVADFGALKPTNSKVTWSLAPEDTAYATLKDGVVTPKTVTDSHKITVTATSADNPAIQASLVVTVYPAVKSVSVLQLERSAEGAEVGRTVVTGQKLTVSVGETLDLTAICNPVGSVQPVTWKLSSALAQLVDADGTVWKYSKKAAWPTTGLGESIQVQALKKGTVTISATATDGSAKLGKITLIIVD